MEGTEKDFYRDPLIAMAFFAILFFIILVVIIALWCKKRRQTEVKTVVIEPKRRPISTKPAKQSNGGSQHTNGDIDLEAGAITADEIELSDDQEEETSNPHGEQVEVKAEDLEESDDTKEMVDTASSEPHEAEKGETNPSFQKDDDDDDDDTQSSPSS